jgi:hypothetical protein
LGHIYVNEFNRWRMDLEIRLEVHDAQYQMVKLTLHVLPGCGVNTSRYAKYVVPQHAGPITDPAKSIYLSVR